MELGDVSVGYRRGDVFRVSIEVSVSFRILTEKLVSVSVKLYFYKYWDQNHHIKNKVNETINIEDFVG